MARQQAVLEQNEDLIAAVVENMQLGRLSDCFTHFSTLQQNLLSLARELDDYPVVGNFDPFESIGEYPDEIMRKDVLDDLRPREQIPISTRTEMAPSCVQCRRLGHDSVKCRVELQHVAPPHTITAEENDALNRVALVLFAQHSSNPSASSDAGGVSVLVKRVHRRWTPHERHSILLAISVYGHQTTPKSLAPSAIAHTARWLITSSRRLAPTFCATPQREWFPPPLRATSRPFS
jgi:hypothetical protein